jgi:hypothetical protein
MASVHSRLTCRPGTQARIEIVKCFFGEDFHDRNLESFDAYFRYYGTELAMLQFGSSPLSRQSTDLAAQTHEDILFIARTMQQSAAETRAALRQTLQTRFRDAKPLALNRSIDLTIRLWLSLNVREDAFRLQSPQTPTLKWDDTSTLEDFLARLFPRAKYQLQAREGRLHPYFTVANMIRICGLKVEWTESLEDHLRLDRRQKALRLYPFKCCLTAHLARTADLGLGSGM